MKKILVMVVAMAMMMAWTTNRAIAQDEMAQADIQQHVDPLSTECQQWIEDNINKAVDKFRNELIGTKKKPGTIPKIKSKQEKQDTAIGAIKSRQDKQDAAISAIKSRQDKQDAAVVTIEKELRGPNGKGGIIKEIGEIKTEQGNQKTRISDIEKLIASNRTLGIIISIISAIALIIGIVAVIGTARTDHKPWQKRWWRN